MLQQLAACMQACNTMIDVNECKDYLHLHGFIEGSFTSIMVLHACIHAAGLP